MPRNHSRYQTVNEFPSSPDIPLFGNTERSSGSRVCNILLGFITIFVVIFTMISAFIFDKNSRRGLNITLTVVIAMLCASHLFLIVWYRQGNMDPKFKILIYYNTFCLTLLCVCANIYFHGA